MVFSDGYQIFIAFPESFEVRLTASIDGSRFKSMGFMTMKTCWFLCVRPPASRRAARQKYCTQPCLPKKVEGSPRGRPNLNGKLWMPGDRGIGPWSGIGRGSNDFEIYPEA